MATDRRRALAHPSSLVAEEEKRDRWEAALRSRRSRGPVRAGMPPNASERAIFH